MICDSCISAGCIRSPGRQLAGSPIGRSARPGDGARAHPQDRLSPGETGQKSANWARCRWLRRVVRAKSPPPAGHPAVGLWLVEDHPATERAGEQVEPGFDEPVALRETSDMSIHRLGLIGAGSMGTNHARVMAESSRAKLEVVVDIDKEKSNQLAVQYGAISATEIDAVLDCDAVVVASSTPAHKVIALAMIDHGIPLLIEKPVAIDLEDVYQICQAATDKGIALACGFVERFNAVVNQGMELLDGEPIHIVTLRHSPIYPRIADSVVYDLLIHDIDLALRFMGSQGVRSVSGASWNARGGDTEIADCTLLFSNDGLATLSASRVGQRKLRSVQVFTNTMMLDLDLLRADLTVYRNVSQGGPDVAHSLTYRAETIIDIPFVRHKAEPLGLELDHFLDLVEGTADRSAEIAGLIAPHEIAQHVENACDQRRRTTLLPRPLPRT
jgi:predicted dehydrogenase